MADEYDVIVIGAGSTGENVAGYAVANGLSVVLVERELVGGECTYWACMPSKALLRPGEVLASAQRVPSVAPAISGSIDVGKALKGRDAFTSGWDDTGQVQWVENAGADLVRGTARLNGERTVDVEQADGTTRTLRARRGVVVASGSVAAKPPIEGLDQIHVWDNREATAIKEVPDRFVVLGGGVVGCELSQAYRRLGASEVTVVEAMDRLLPVEEPFVGEELEQALEDDGIQVRVGAKATRVSRAGNDGPVTLTLDDGSEIVGDELLVATGRRPTTQDLGLETVGLTPGKWIEVDDQMRVKGVDGDWLYACGDVNGRALLTHQGKYQARLVGDLLGGRDRTDIADLEAIPRVVFTDPQVAAVGLTEKQARDQDRDVRTVEQPTTANAGGALLGQGYGGTSKLVIDNRGETIVGATFVGPHTGEILHSATIAIISGITVDRLWHAVPSFPTVSEVWLRLLETDRGL